MNESNRIRTTCPYCGVGCGMSLTHNHRTVQGLEGDADHPANYARLCVKGSSVHETLGENGRLTHPTINGEYVSWQNASQEIASRIEHARNTKGAGAIAAYLSGQLLTEDYYVANKLFKGFIGTPHVDTNSRLCMSSAVSGYKRAFGADAVPCNYEDLEEARLLVIIGSNLAWNHPVLYQRIKVAKQKNPLNKIVIIDPRATETCEIADLYLGIRPGGDISLFNGLLSYMAQHGGLNTAFIQEHTEQFEEVLQHAISQSDSLEDIAEDCGINAERLTTFYHWFTKEPKVVTLFSQGTNQSKHGTDRVNAIINCHLAGGRLGYAGAGPFSITGQPNAMGGREVGGLANQLAAHMDYHTPGAIDRLTRFWSTPSLTPDVPSSAGHKALELIEAIERGDIEVLWIMATNPAVSLPDSARVRRALKKCPTVIVSEAMSTSDTLSYADIVLPASSWAEKDGTVTNSERRISRQRGFLPPPGEAKHDWQALCEVAKALGYEEAFDYEGSWQIFSEHARLSGFENSSHPSHTARLFDISLLSKLDKAGYDALQPIQWPVTHQSPEGTPRLFTDAMFATSSGKASFVPVDNETLPPRTSSFVINTGRLRDQWHTMTRSSRAARLNQHRAEPTIDIHPHDARAQGLSEGDIIRLENDKGSYTGKVRFASGQRRQELFIPIHWSQQFSHNALASALINDDRDPISGQPSSKYAQVSLHVVPVRWFATLIVHSVLSTEQLEALNLDYWARIGLKHGYRYELIADKIPNKEELSTLLVGSQPSISSHSPQQPNWRGAWLNHGKLSAWIRTSTAPFELDDQWLDDCLASDSISQEERRQLLSGQPAQGEIKGKIICSCHQVGQCTIERTIHAGADSVEQLGKILKCGTQCGSCLPELKRMLETELTTDN